MNNSTSCAPAVCGADDGSGLRTTSNTTSSLAPVNWNLACSGLAGGKQSMTTRNLGGYIPLSSLVFSSSILSPFRRKKSTSVIGICEITNTKCNYIRICINTLFLRRYPNAQQSCAEIGTTSSRA